MCYVRQNLKKILHTILFRYKPSKANGENSLK